MLSGWRASKELIYPGRDNWSTSGGGRRKGESEKAAESKGASPYLEGAFIKVALPRDKYLMSSDVRSLLQMIARARTYKRSIAFASRAAQSPKRRCCLFVRTSVAFFFPNVLSGQCHYGWDIDFNSAMYRRVIFQSRVK